MFFCGRTTHETQEIVFCFLFCFVLVFLVFSFGLLLCVTLLIDITVYNFMRKLRA